MYRFLLWDIDGTVLDFLASEAYAVRTMFEKYQLGECSDEMLRMYSRINAKYWEALERNEMTKQQILTGRFVEFFGMYGIDASIASDFNRDYQSALGDHLVFAPYAEEMLRAEMGKYMLVAVTNGTKIAQSKKIRKSGLDKIFDSVFISEDVGTEKPNAEYFDYVFKSVGIKDKTQALIIGDSLTSDMKGAENVGIDSCWYNPKHAVNRQNVRVTYEIDDLRKIAEILEQNQV